MGLRLFGDSEACFWSLSCFRRHPCQSTLDTAAFTKPAHKALWYGMSYGTAHLLGSVSCRGRIRLQRRCRCSGCGRVMSHRHAETAWSTFSPHPPTRYFDDFLSFPGFLCSWFRAQRISTALPYGRVRKTISHHLCVDGRMVAASCWVTLWA